MFTRRRVIWAGAALLGILALAAIWLLVGRPNDFVTIQQIKDNPYDYAGKQVKLRGYGVTTSKAQLCPGYSGLDTRSFFIDQQENTIVAVVKQPALDLAHDQTLRSFTGTIQVYRDQIGCPGNLLSATIPYFEIESVEE